MEPERQIEKLLRRFAKKRRDDAGDDAFKLHPATRRLLQNEVARCPSKTNQESRLAKLFGRLHPGFIYAACFAVMIFMGASLLLPSLSKAKNRSQLAGATSNLKQLGLAAHEFADENNHQLPQSLMELRRLAGTNPLVDPASGKPFVYVAGGRNVDSLRPDSVLAYSPDDTRNRAVLFADGHVEAVDRTRFSEITNRGLIQLAFADTARRPEIAELPAAPPANIPAFAGNLNGNDFENRKMKTEGPALKKSATPAAGLAGAGEQFDKSVTAGDTVTVGGVSRLLPATMDTQNFSSNANAASPAATKLDGLAVSDALAGKFAAQKIVNPETAALSRPFSQTGNQAGAQNIFKNAAASAKMTPVLANFQFQQNGSALAVVDEDGSVYKGYCVVAGQAKTQNAPLDLPGAQLQTAPAQLLAKDFQSNTNQQALAQNYFFRVSGTNRSLQQNVVFTGTVLAFSNPATAAQNFNGNFGGSGGGNRVPGMNNNSTPVEFLSNSRIAGTAVVNRTNEIEINALPVTP